MHTIRPARRYPRVTAIVRARWGCAVATVDPWEVRTARTVRVRPTEAAFVLTALLTRERPSFLVVPRSRSSVVRAALAVAKERGVRVLPPPRPAVLDACAAKLDVLLPGVPLKNLPQSAHAALALAVATLHGLPLWSSPPRRHAEPHR